MPDDVRHPVIDKSRMPSRHVTIGPERAPHRAFLYSMGLSAEQIAQPLVGVATTWKHLQLLGDESTGRVHQVTERQLEMLGPLLDAQDLLHRARTPGTSLDRRVIGHHADAAAVDHADAGDDPVSAHLLWTVAVGQQPVLDEWRLGVEEKPQPLPHWQFALGRQPAPIPLRAPQLGQPFPLSELGPPPGALVGREGRGDGKVAHLEGEYREHR